MKNAEYYAERMRLIEEAQHKSSEEIARSIGEHYEDAKRRIEEKIRSWYQRLADNNELSFEEARKLLTSDELDEFHWDVKKYIERGRESAISGAWAKELENASAKYHITRLEALKMQVRQICEEVTGKRLEETKKGAERAFTEAYYRTAYEIQNSFGVGVNMNKIDRRLLNDVLRSPWATDGRNFSNRVYADLGQAVEVINRELTHMLLAGENPDRAIAEIRKQLGISQHRAATVVLTENAIFSIKGQKKCYEDLGVEKYVILETLDACTCPICGDMDGKVFPRSEMVMGENAPIFHPRCRGTTAPYFDDEGLPERFARDIETGEGYYMPAGSTYNDWKKQQEELYGKGSIDKKRLMHYNEKADTEQYKRYKSVLRELSPSSFEEFQDVKYNNSDKWKNLKYQYRTLNQYKIDSGSLTAKGILDLDEKIITEKRANFTSEYKKSGNIAGAYIDNNTNNMYLSHSNMQNDTVAQKYKGESHIVLLKSSRRFRYIDVKKNDGTLRTHTYYDTEAKLFELFADIYDEKPFTSITMLSERGMCDSCKDVMEQFKKKYPKVTVSVVSNKNTEGNVWKHRRN